MKRPVSLRAPAVLLPVALLAASCSDYGVAEQDLTLRYDAPTDALTLAIDSRGIHPRPGRDVVLFGEPPSLADRTQRAGERLREVGGGRRYLVLLDLPLALDLDHVGDALAEEGDDERARALGERWEVIRATISVEDAALYVDEGGHVGALQRVRIDEAQSYVAFVNDLISAAVEGAQVADDAPERNKAADRRRAEYARSGAPWVVLDADALEVRMPIEPWELANMIRALADPAGEAEASEADAEERRAEGYAPTSEDLVQALVQAIFHDLDSLEVVEGVARFRFPFGDDGAVRMPFRVERSPAPAAALRAMLSDLELPELSTAEVAARLRDGEGGGD